MYFNEPGPASAAVSLVFVFVFVFVFVIVFPIVFLMTEADPAAVSLPLNWLVAL